MTGLFAGIADTEAEAKKLKARLAAEIIAALNESHVTAAAKVARVDAADIQRIRNADLSPFTIEHLSRIREALQA